MPRLGLIVPTTNTVNEIEWKRMALPGMAFALQRMRLHQDQDSLFEDLDAVLERFQGEKPDVISYACTAGSLVLPLERLTSYMEERCGVACVATAPALVHACRALGLRRIALATPYHDALNEHEREFFAACGIETVRMRGLGIGAGGPHEYVQIARVPADQVYEHCRATDTPEAQGMIVSCTDFRTLDAIPRLEAELGKPVISSNLATFWAALRRVGIRDRITGCGSLLSGH